MNEQALVVIKTEMAERERGEGEQEREKKAREREEREKERKHFLLQVMYESWIGR